jgi:hypothetical protein
MHTIEPVADDGPRGGSIGRVVVLAAPLLVVGLAAILWLTSNQLLYIGPLDRATFGWLVVVPLWAAAPFAAGIAWRNLTARARATAAGICALVIGAPVAFLLWQEAAFANCQFGSTQVPLAWWTPAIVLGVVFGGGFGVNALVATGQVRDGHRWRAFAVAAIGQVAVAFTAAVLTFVMFFGLCQRP